jgi:hypothetical protein
MCGKRKCIPNVRPAEHRFGFLDIRQQPHATLEVGLAIQCRADLPGRPVQQANAEPLLQLLDRVGDGGAGKLKVVGGLREALELDDPDEHPHGIEAVHMVSWIVYLAWTVMANLLHLSVNR